MSIPASAIVQVNPGVIGAGGSALDLNGLILTHDTAVPIGFVQGFSNADDVADFFGDTAPETEVANVYFLGFDNSTKKPGVLSFVQYPDAAVPAYLRGGSLAAMTLAQLKALTGTLIISINGAEQTSSAISLTAATSFSDAASIIDAAFTALPGTVEYDSQRAAFLITSGTDGVASTISLATGTIADGLKLTAAHGALTSQGADAGVPASIMNTVIDITQNWASFMTMFEPDLDGKIAFAEWTNSRNNRFVYAAWDTDPLAIVQNDTANFGAVLKKRNLSGTAAIYQDIKKAAFALGTIASIDFDRLNGRITLAFKSQSGLAADVSNQTVSETLIANGYNFYGAYGTANDEFVWHYPGQISGSFKWIDGYVNQIWMNNGFQQAFMTLLKMMNSIPYNIDGDALIEAAAMDPIDKAFNFGAIRKGVSLSSLQAAAVNNAAGLDIAGTLTTRGWYLQILPATPQVRAARGTPPMTFWYMDGGSVQKIALASIAIQ